MLQRQEVSTLRARNRVRWRHWVLAASLSFTACLTQTTTEKIGGSWTILWVTGQLMVEAGMTHSYLSRGRGLFPPRIASLMDYRYFPEDCLLFTTSFVPDQELYAACGDHEPLMLVRHRPFHGGKRAAGLEGDAIGIAPGVSVSLAEVRRRATRQPARAGDWQIHPRFGGTLEVAVQGSPEDVRRTIAAGARVNAPDLDGRLPLEWAAFWGRADNVVALLAAGADPRAQDADGRSALMLGAWNPAIVEALLKAGGPVDAADRQGETALFFATRARAGESIRRLCEAGADPLLKNRAGETVLQVAEKDRALANVHAQLLPLFPPEQRIQSQRKKELREATEMLYSLADRRGPDEIRELLLKGADPNSTDSSDRKTALMSAAEGGRADNVVLLLAAGADARRRDDSGGTALMEAAHTGDAKSLAALLAANSEVNAQMKDGETALYWAAFMNRPECVRLLLDAGADPTLKTKAGETPLAMARKRGPASQAVVQLLERAAPPKRE
jgi:ankyrin repeat protein